MVALLPKSFPSVLVLHLLIPFPSNDQAWIDYVTKIFPGDSFLSYDNDLPSRKRILTKTYFTLKHVGVKEADNFGPEPSNCLGEKYAVIVTPCVD